MVSKIAQNALVNVTRFAIANNAIPREGAQSIPIGPFNFKTTPTYSFNFTLSQEQSKLSIVQTLYIDNGANPYNLICDVGVSGQEIVAPPFSQGYYPILAVNNLNLAISSAGAVDCASAIYLINVPIEPYVWSTVSETQCGPLGYQQLTGISSATSLTVPSGAKYALINFEAQNSRWRDDGTAPTGTVGMLNQAGDYFFYTGNLAALQFIQATSGAIVNVSYYG